MAYLHYNEIAHRDLKPENLLLTANGDLKLADFGVSEDFSSVSDDNESGMVANTKGSWPFFSPEMVDADIDNKYDAYKADVWAAASCLWVFVFGSLPFWQPHDPHNPQPIFDKLIEAKTKLPPYPSRKSPELYQLFEQMFTANPVERPTFKDCEQMEWIRIHTTIEIESALTSAGTNLMITDKEIDELSVIRAGDVSTISENIKSRMLQLALKSKQDVGARGEHIVKERNHSISDKKEVRKSLTRVYNTPPPPPTTEARKSTLTSLPSFVDEELPQPPDSGTSSTASNRDLLSGINLELSSTEEVADTTDKNARVGDNAPQSCCSVS